MMPRITILGVFLVSGLFGTAASAQEIDVPLDLQTAIFYKALDSDENLSAREGDLVIGIVTDEDTVGRVSMLTYEFGKLASRTVQGKTIGDVVAINGSDPDELPGNLEMAGVNVIYLPMGAQRFTTQAAVAYAKQNQLLTLGGSIKLARRGVAICLTVEDGKITVVLNLRAARLQGMQISEALIGVAKVIRK